MTYHLNIPETGYSYRTDILEHIMTCLNDMVQRHCKVFTIRLDVRFPENIHAEFNNSEISRLINRLKEYLRYKNIDMKFTWAREQKQSHNQHYHVVLFIDGSKVQNGWGIR